MIKIRIFECSICLLLDTEINVLEIFFYKQSKLFFILFEHIIKFSLITEQLQINCKYKILKLLWTNYKNTFYLKSKFFKMYMKFKFSFDSQKKTSIVVFSWKRRTSSVVFLVTILFLMAWYRPLEIILAKKTTELVLLFHKNITKLVFLWPNMGQKCFKVLTYTDFFT